MWIPIFFAISIEMQNFLLKEKYQPKRLSWVAYKSKIFMRCSLWDPIVKIKTFCWKHFVLLRMILPIIHFHQFLIIHFPRCSNTIISTPNHEIISSNHSTSWKSKRLKLYFFISIFERFKLWILLRWSIKKWYKLVQHFLKNYGFYYGMTKNWSPDIKEVYGHDTGPGFRQKPKISKMQW